MSEPMVLRPCVQRFAEAMERKLRDNDHKPGWQHDIPASLVERAREELDELDDAVLCGEDASFILDEAADVANFAMMIAERCEAIEKEHDAP
jgi:NTP pyrophosphatase (non-canonical NTP hydrolase)